MKESRERTKAAASCCLATLTEPACRQKRRAVEGEAERWGDKGRWRWNGDDRLVVLTDGHGEGGRQARNDGRALAVRRTTSSENGIQGDATTTTEPHPSVVDADLH